MLLLTTKEEEVQTLCGKKKKKVFVFSSIPKLWGCFNNVLNVFPDYSLVPCIFLPVAARVVLIKQKPHYHSTQHLHCHSESKPKSLQMSSRLKICTV